MVYARFLTVALLFALWTIVPFALTHWGRLPHAHVLIGNVTESELQAHIFAEENNAAHHALSHQMGQQYQDGWILSIPFGSLGNFLAFVLVMVFAGVIVFSYCEIWHAVLARAFAARRVHLQIPHPPPRCVNTMQTRAAFCA